MSERMDQARAEAWRRFPEGWDPYNEEPVDDWGYSKGQREAFCAGVEWADANPKPHTITRAELGAAADEFTAAGTTGEWVSIEDMLIEALGTLEIEVDDDDDMG